MKHNTKIHYGWIMLAFTVLAAFIYVGLCSNTVSLYVQPVSTANGFPRGLFTLKNSIASIISGVLAFFYGKLLKKFSLKKIMIAGCISIIICYIIQSVAKSLPVFYLSALFQGLGFGLCASTSLTILINRWFAARFGLITGIVYTATSLGGAIFFPLIGNMMSADNSLYTKGFLFSAICVFIFLVILIVVFVEFPSDIGLKPIYDNDAKSTGVLEDEPGLTFAEIKKQKTFIPSLLLIVFTTIGAASVQGTMTARLVDVGFTLTFATSIVSILYIFTSLAKVPAGILADKYGMLPVTLVSALSAIIALFFLIFVNSELLAYMMTPFMGVTMVLMTVPAPLLGPTLFGRKAISQYSGIFICMQTAGVAVGQTVFNFMYDASGSYVSSYIVCIIILVLCSLGYIWIIKVSPVNWLLENENHRTKKGVKN